jgi:hypothetical protein
MAQSADLSLRQICYGEQILVEVSHGIEPANSLTTAEQE